MNSRIVIFVAGCCLLLAEPKSTWGDEPPAEINSGKTELIGVLEVPGNQKDRSGLTEVLRPATFSDDEFSESTRFTNDLFGGISAVAATGDGQHFYFLADRGPLDGAVDWSCRVHRCKLNIDSDRATPLRIEIVETILLRDEAGRPFTGLAAAFEPSENRSSRFDPEGIRITSAGNFLVSDEYGPRVIEFTPEGSFVREFEVPSHLRISNPGLNKKDENGKNSTGRSSNRGMEGLALSDDQQTVYGLMQSPLLQDSGRKQLSQKPVGLNVRLLEFSIQGNVQKELVYHLDSEDYKLNEIVGCGEDRFLVIERDGEAGDEAQFKKLMLISAQSATNVAGVASLPRLDLPKQLIPVKKSVFLDLLSPQWGLVGGAMPEKIECLAFGPNLPDGRQTLVVVSDNDFSPDQPTAIYVFAFSSLRKVAVSENQISGSSFPCP